MKVLLIGSTGMLGQALYHKFLSDSIEVITASRSNSKYNLELFYQTEKLIDIIDNESPDIVINTAALINLKECEENPREAYLLNSFLPGVLEQACRKTRIFFVQISTDHYYVNNGRKLHTENDRISLVNQYARTKYAGEAFTLTYENSLVVRTNIVGFRNKKNRPTFIEWVIQTLNHGETITGFDNYYTSSIDVYHFSDILLELMKKKTKGIINLASKNVLSKYEFIFQLASLLGNEDLVLRGDMNQYQGIKRANSLGLDVTKLSTIISESKIPSSSEVIYRIVEKYKGGAMNEL